MLVLDRHFTFGDGNQKHDDVCPLVLPAVVHHKIVQDRFFVGCATGEHFPRLAGINPAQELQQRSKRAPRLMSDSEQGMCHSAIS